MRAMLTVDVSMFRAATGGRPSGAGVAGGFAVGGPAPPAASSLPRRCAPWAYIERWRIRVKNLKTHLGFGGGYVNEC